MPNLLEHHSFHPCCDGGGVIRRMVIACHHQYIPTKVNVTSLFVGGGTYAYDTLFLCGPPTLPYITVGTMGWQSHCGHILCCVEDRLNSTETSNMLWAQVTWAQSLKTTPMSNKTFFFYWVRMDINWMIEISTHVQIIEFHASFFAWGNAWRGTSSHVGGYWALDMLPLCESLKPYGSPMH